MCVPPDVGVGPGKQMTIKALESRVKQIRLREAFGLASTAGALSNGRRMGKEVV